MKIQSSLRTIVRGLSLLLGLTVASCSVGPDYHRPPLDVPAAYKSSTEAETGVAPHLVADWWRLFNDPNLTTLEQEALQYNQDLKAAIARVTEARAAARAVKSQFYPVITLDPSAQRSRTPALHSNGLAGSTATTTTDIQIPFDLSYEVDIWGRVRRSYEASKAQTRAAEDDLAVVRQTMEADVAQNYFNLRAFDTQDKILNDNVEIFRKQLELTQMQFNAGLISQTNVLQAQTQLDMTLAQEMEIRRQRADVEHALAILTGKPPAALTLAPRPLTPPPPAVPPGLPADVLRQRPDVAEAEENLVAANAQIGVAQAAFFPTVTLTGTAGFESIDIRHALDWENRIWSLGPGMTLPIFEGGKLRANLEQSKGRYQELLANYRSAVLTAFHDVEDALNDLHLQADEAVEQARTVEAARESLRLIEIQYRQGLVDYLQVIAADQTLLSNELSVAQISGQRLVSTVLLIKALGGGWQVAPPPTVAQKSAR